MVANVQKKWTVEEYLAFERGSEERHEYFDGDVYPVGRPPKPSTHGTGRRHSLIITNIGSSLGNQLINSTCEVYMCDMRVKVGLIKYCYPDVSVVSNEPFFADGEFDILLNPIVIVEVLSPSTELDDRGKKFSDYQTLESLQEYILIAQDEIQVDHYIRQSQGDWLLSIAKTAESEIHLPSVNCTLLLADIYRKITFASDNTDGV